MVAIIRNKALIVRQKTQGILPQFPKFLTTYKNNFADSILFLRLYPHSLTKQGKTYERIQNKRH